MLRTAQPFCVYGAPARSYCGDPKCVLPALVCNTPKCTCSKDHAKCLDTYPFDIPFNEIRTRERLNQETI